MKFGGGFKSADEAHDKLHSLPTLSEQRGETMRTLFFAGTVGLLIGGILITHVFYAQRFGAGINKPELGGGIVFALFGLMLLYSGFQEMVIVGSPHTTVTLTPASPRAGQEVLFQWTIHGEVDRLRKVRIELHGEESVTHDIHMPRPKDIERTVFTPIAVAEAEAPIREKGSARMLIPADARPSSVSPDGKVLVYWGVHIVCELTNGDTFEDDYTVKIRPAF